MQEGWEESDGPESVGCGDLVQVDAALKATAISRYRGGRLGSISRRGYFTRRPSPLGTLSLVATNNRGGSVCTLIPVRMRVHRQQKWRFTFCKIVYETDVRKVGQAGSMNRWNGCLSVCVDYILLVILVFRIVAMTACVHS